PMVRLVRNPMNRGKGYSVRHGIQEASGEVILFIDADNSTPIEDADKVLRAIEGGADVAVGSRWLERELQHRPQPWHRRVNGRLYNALVRFLLMQGLKDTQNGFKAYKRLA